MSEDFERGECTSSRCKAAVIWTLSERGEKHPVDYEPSPDGTLALTFHGRDVPTSRVVGPKFRFGRTDLRKSHFATCVDATRFRKRSQS